VALLCSSVSNSGDTLTLAIGTPFGMKAKGVDAGFFCSLYRQQRGGA
jgi:hypothetical protein